MKFDYICDNLPDGLVLIDEVFLAEMNEDILYSLEILLDREGETELIYDFADEPWSAVWDRETALIKEFCNSGKMFVFSFDNDMPNCEFELVENCGGIHISVPSGRLTLVNAGELIQCLIYPELEMEKVMEVNLEAGDYFVECEKIEHIRLSKVK